MPCCMFSPSRKLVVMKYSTLSKESKKIKVNELPYGIGDLSSDFQFPFENLG